MKYKKNTRDSVSWGCPKDKKRVEITTRSGVFLTIFEVFEVIFQKRVRVFHRGFQTREN